jgi:hypothetical protein
MSMGEIYHTSKVLLWITSGKDSMKDVSLSTLKKKIAAVAARVSEFK